MIDVSNIMRSLAAARDAAAAREATPEWQAEMAAKAKREAREAAEWPFKASSIAEYLHADDLELLIAGSHAETPCLRLVRHWAEQARADEPSENWNRWLWLNGPRGAGKTMAAAWAIQALCPDQPAARYTTFPTLMRLVRDLDAFKPEIAREAEDRIQSIVRSKLVVLDEVGQEPESQKELARVTLHRFVDSRRMGRGLTLVLTNKTAAAIRGRFEDGWYDSRTESRLRQLLTRDRSGKGLHDVGGEDLRGAPV